MILSWKIIVIDFFLHLLPEASPFLWFHLCNTLYFHKFFHFCAVCCNEITVKCFVIFSSWLKSKNISFLPLISSGKTASEFFLQFRILICLLLKMIYLSVCCLSTDEVHCILSYGGSFQIPFHSYTDSPGFEPGVLCFVEIQELTSTEWTIIPVSFWWIPRC